MCNCINEVQDKLKDAYQGQYKGREITQITLHKIMPFSIDDGQLKEPKVCINYDVERVGVSRAAKEKIIATYCPFCGEEYDKS